MFESMAGMFHMVTNTYLKIALTLVSLIAVGLSVLERYEAPHFTIDQL